MLTIKRLVQVEIGYDPTDMLELPIAKWDTRVELCNIWDKDCLLKNVKDQLNKVYRSRVKTTSFLGMAPDNDDDCELFSTIDGMYQGVFFELTDCMHEPGVYVSVFDSYEDMRNGDEADGGGIVEYYPQSNWEQFMFPEKELDSQAEFVLDTILGK